ncbi:MAG: acyl-CoA dehydrogenase family protein [Microthrixaceae bacterium]|nr:acyl-CoA dehydrogenase family protein [Microthrixaceae bacterium]
MRDGDEWVVNGTKMWTSLASDADYCWLAARTDPEAPKHKGISILAIDMSSPGITVNPLHLMSTHDVNETVWSDVRVPDANLVGARVGDGT